MALLAAPPFYLKKNGARETDAIIIYLFTYLRR